jgi:Domain of unknown function (DUF1844)
MADKKQDSFKVTDRRLFTSDGELRKDAAEESVATATPPPSPRPSEALAAEPPPPAGPTDEQQSVPDAPTAAEQQAQADAYKQSSKDLDSRVELSGHSARDLEMTFERFMASLYMTAMLQLGLMREQNAPPAVDLIGARQTIDTISLLAEKTKGNLTSTEENFVQNCLYELRMAYVEVTNAINRPPQAPAPNAAPSSR